MTEMGSYCNDGKGTKEQVGKVNQERTPTQGTAFWDRAKPIWVPIPAQTLESKLFTVSELSPRVEKVGESGKKFFKCTLFGYDILYLKFHHQFLEVHVCVCVCLRACVIVPVVNHRSFVSHLPITLHFGQIAIVSEPWKGPPHLLGFRFTICQMQIIKIVAFPPESTQWKRTTREGCWNL